MVPLSRQRTSQIQYRLAESDCETLSTSVGSRGNTKISILALGWIIVPLGSAACTCALVTWGDLGSGVRPAMHEITCHVCVWRARAALGDLPAAVISAARSGGCRMAE